MPKGSSVPFGFTRSRSGGFIDHARWGKGKNTRSGWIGWFDDDDPRAEGACRVVYMGKQLGMKNSFVDIFSCSCNTTPTRAGKIVVVDERASEPRRNFFPFDTFKSSTRRHA